MRRGRPQDSGHENSPGLGEKGKMRGGSREGEAACARQVSRASSLGLCTRQAGTAMAAGAGEGRTVSLPALPGSSALLCR